MCILGMCIAKASNATAVIFEEVQTDSKQLNTRSTVIAAYRARPRWLRASRSRGVAL